MFSRFPPHPAHTKSMRKRLYIALAVLVTAALAVVGWQVLRPPEPEPVYQGKPLSSWLNYRTALKPMPRKIQEQEADDAVRQAGTNALSTLLRMLRAKDSRWKTE